MKHFLLLLLLPAMLSCKGQNNPKYLGGTYGTFHLDKITFAEQPDTLLSKIERYYKLPEDDGYFNDTIKQFIKTGTLFHIYRILPKHVTAGMFMFNTLKLPAGQIVDFYVDSSQRLRKLEFSVYMTEAEYKKLMADSKGLKDITPDNVRKFNQDKYVIFQQEDEQKQTTLYCLDNRKENEPGKDYFLRIAVMSLRIKTDKFYKRQHTDMRMGATGKE
ncbi:hypothetical protein HHL17_26850 [Chitinophaga sp. G-6-1-13]|uniref:Lipoprotein n=1 Tax=Chitinophaga fulva TaxID=2728842 RepID=A0A848GQF2_9BACT|nr:hypothetical protein [Chitinophaga fulva]NML40845.1 hypothetical protein [Chitinophaga fulva]